MAQALHVTTRTVKAWLMFFTAVHILLSLISGIVPLATDAYDYLKVFAWISFFVMILIWAMIVWGITRDTQPKPVPVPPVGGNRS